MKGVRALALACATALAGCAPSVAPSHAAIVAGPDGLDPGANRLQLEPLVAIVSGVGLEWLLEARPRDLLADEAVARELARLIDPARAERFAARYGGVDLRQAQEVVLAGYERAFFGAARIAVAPAKVEAAFAHRAEAVEGRAVAGGVTRLWGTVDGAREQIAIFAQQGVALEHGQLGPLRPAVYFAQGKLQRARPAIRSEPLASIAPRVADAPIRFYAPGPFEDPWAAGMGGLFRATTAVAAAAWCVPGPRGPGLHLRFVLAGTWGDDAQAAADRFAAAFNVLAQDPLGHLTGLDRPLEAPRVSASPAALELDVTFDLAALAGGLRAATGASLPEILGLSAAH
jgi:hypothetical protein